MIKSTRVIELLTGGVGSNASGYNDLDRVEVMFDDGTYAFLSAKDLANAAVIRLQQQGEMLSLESAKIAEDSHQGKTHVQVTFDDGTVAALNEEELKNAVS